MIYPHCMAYLDNMLKGRSCHGAYRLVILEDGVMESEKVIEIRRHILENAIQLHENVISMLRDEISSLDENN